MAFAYGYKWNEENGTVQYDINVRPNDFVKLPIDFDALDSDLELNDEKYWKMDSKLSSGMKQIMMIYTTNPNSPRRNYQAANNAGDRDGQGTGGGIYQEGAFGEYSYGKSSLVNNYTRVYKGGGWKDDAYWLSPGARRFANQDLSQNLLDLDVFRSHGMGVQ